MELLARARERSGLRYCAQNLELTKIHACYPPIRRRRPSEKGGPPVGCRSSL